MKSREEILESGLLEQFVLGLTDSKENKLIEEALINFPDLKSYLERLEKTMETVAFQNAVIPPEELRAATLQKIEASDKISVNQFNRKYIWTSMIAGVLSLGLLYSTYAYYQDCKATEEKLASIETELSEKILECEDKNSANKRLLALYEDESYQQIVLKNEKADNITVFWSEDKTEAFLLCKNIPKPETGKTYQIWADVDKIMMPLGIFDGSEKLLKIKCLKKATSLNVTIEKAGGSDHPDVSNLILTRSV